MSAPDEKSPTDAVREFEEMLATMATPGWRLFMEDMRRVRAGVENIRNVSNLDYAKGEVSALDLVIGWQRATEIGYEQAQALLAAPEEGTDD